MLDRGLSAVNVRMPPLPAMGSNASLTENVRYKFSANPEFKTKWVEADLICNE